MTLTELIPALKGAGRRRAVDEVDRLREDNIKLLNRQAAADDFFAILMNDVVTTNAAWEHEKQLRGEAEEAAAQMRMQRDEWRDEALRLRAKFGPQLAAEANAARITVPPMVRDTSAVEDQATGPIYVRPLQESAAAGLLEPVTDPAQSQGGTMCENSIRDVVHVLTRAAALTVTYGPDPTSCIRAVTLGSPNAVMPDGDTPESLLAEDAEYRLQRHVNPNSAGADEDYLVSEWAAGRSVDEVRDAFLAAAESLEAGMR